MAKRYSKSSSYTFSNAPSVSVPRSTFDLSHGHKTAIDAEYLYPIFFMEVLPGDTIQCKPAVFGRLATPQTPYMDNLWIDYFFGFCPYRIVHANFKKVMGEVSPSESGEFYLPQMTSPAGGYAEQSLFDYFGLPTKVEGMTHQSLPLRAYKQFWNDWFRRPHVQDILPLSLSDGPDDPADFTLLKRNKKHDYFAGALPAAQAGDPVTLPIGGIAPVVPAASNPNATLDMGLAGIQPLRASTAFGLSGTNTALVPGTDSVNVGQNVAAPWSYTGMEADLSSATAATVNSIRLAFQTQRFLEREMRSGNRYTEILRSFYGVTSEDQRLQRVELLSVGKTYLNASAVPQTSNTVTGGDDASPQGNLAAYATTGGEPAGFVKSFTEHGCIIGLANLRATLSYQEGLHRDWSRRSRFDFAWPVFAHLGEQEIKNKEIQARGDANGDDDPWAFQERYAEYRYRPTMITGRFRSNATQSLEFWHFSEYFGASFPSYNESFLQESPPIQRVLAVQDEPFCILDMHFQVKATRPLPTYSVPGMIDHF